MDRFERLGKLVKLIEAVGGTINSKKKLHKMIYILQFAGEDFDQNYTFHHYGVFSPTLAKDLDIAYSDGFLAITSSAPYGFNINITDRTQDDFFKNITIDKQMISLAEKLVKEEPRLLEALSTIIYLDENYYSRDSLKFKLEELKPDLSDFYDKAFRLAKELFSIEV